MDIVKPNNGRTWIPLGGLLRSMVINCLLNHRHTGEDNDASMDKIDLASETTGKLPVSMLDGYKEPIDPPVASSLVPVGSIIDFAGDSASIPFGWLACDGSAVLRTTYDSLWKVLGQGTIWGAGDGTTTFNVPNLVGRTSVGAGVYSDAVNDPDGGAKTFAVGSVAGEMKHKLVVTEMPSHTHDSMASSSCTATGTNSDVPRYGSTATSSTGGDLAHNNMQPYAVVKKIIRAL